MLGADGGGAFSEGWAGLASAGSTGQSSQMEGVVP